VSVKVRRLTVGRASRGALGDLGVAELAVLAREAAQDVHAAGQRGDELAIRRRRRAARRRHLGSSHGVNFALRKVILREICPELIAGAILRAKNPTEEIAMNLPKALAAALAACALAAPASAQIRIAYIDPLSGSMAATGEHGLHEVEFAAERINAKGGILGQKVEIVPMDNKLSTQESLILLKSAADQGIRYIMQGNGSSVAGALIDALNKHNERNPDKTILFLNYAAVDPDFTNDKCSFWHFRFDANSDMKMDALTTYMKGEKKIQKAYLLNQDYSFGHQVAKAARAMIESKRPDVKIVGEELHPLAKVKDFAPYVAKIQASGADSVITGNWGSDLQLLVKAARDANLRADFYTYYAGRGRHAAGARRIGHRPREGRELLERELGLARRAGLRRRVQEEVRRDLRPLLAGAAPVARVPLAGDDPDQVDGSGDGGEGDGGNERGGRVRQGGDAGRRPPADPAAVHRDVREGRRQAEEHRGRHDRVRLPADSKIEGPRPRGPRAARCSAPERLELFLTSLLNGVTYGLLLFMLSAGLTLIFSMMGVLNFAHASFYMLGAYFGYTISTKVGYFPGWLWRRSSWDRSARWWSAMASGARMHRGTFPSCCSPSGSRS
jgi:ABC-type branched-subunit amino acid transport system substrate-binding protein